MAYCLVIVDMQHYFKAAQNEETQNNCIREIHDAIYEEQPILLVEYRGCGRTVKRIRNLLDQKDYERWYTVNKSFDDGSADIVSTLTGFKLPKHNIRVCGVKTDACVAETVVGLNRRLPKSRITVVADACWSYKNHEQTLSEMRKLKNVRVSPGAL